MIPKWGMAARFLCGCSVSSIDSKQGDISGFFRLAGWSSDIQEIDGGGAKNGGKPLCHIQANGPVTLFHVGYVLARDAPKLFSELRLSEAVHLAVVLQGLAGDELHAFVPVRLC